jgi:hypothetical protein
MTVMVDIVGCKDQSGMLYLKIIKPTTKNSLALGTQPRQGDHVVRGTAHMMVLLSTCYCAELGLNLLVMLHDDSFKVILPAVKLCRQVILQKV